MQSTTFAGQYFHGVLWDLDGTLADTSALHFAAWKAIAEERGKPFHEADFVRTFGRRNPEIIGLLFDEPFSDSEIAHIGEVKEERFRQAARSEGVKLLPGALAIVKALHEAGWKQAIGSSAPRQNIELMMELAGLSHYIEAFIGMEDTRKGKPDPEVFLKAAGKIAVPPGWCVVVEDAVFGIAAAKAGLMPSIAVRGGGHSSREALQEAGASLIVETLDEVTLAHFTRLVPKINKIHSRSAQAKLEEENHEPDDSTCDEG